MIDFRKHVITEESTVLAALNALNDLAADAIIFVVDYNSKLIGSLTDGDIRRGLIRGLTMSSQLIEFIQREPKFLLEKSYSLSTLIQYRNSNVKIIPVLNEKYQVIDIINFRFHKSYLPIQALIMAGGRGERLRPLTDNVPKPLLPVGNKPILEHNIDRLVKFGVRKITISVRYLGDQIIDHFSNERVVGADISFIQEETPLGTAGAMSQIKEFHHDILLLMNSDLLTDINFEEFCSFFLDNDADLAVACVPYAVNIPYAVIETAGVNVQSLKEKPTFTYYSNAGIYLIRKEVVSSFVGESSKIDAPTLIEQLVKAGKKVVAFPMIGYWLDIGKPDDYNKAQKDIAHVNL